MSRPAKLDLHPDRGDILQMVKDGVPYRTIANTINAKYPSESELRISNALISRFMTGSKSPSIAKKIAKDLRNRTAQINSRNKAGEVYDFYEEASQMDSQMNQNLQLLVDLLPEYVANRAQAKDIKALAEATQIYNAIVTTAKGPQTPSSGLTYDEIKKVESEFEN